ncbi:MAG: hypothetical protein F3741_12245 [Nitrospinae bacterium]|nr:hypothetical protein [Nitrospinota bacterium]
MPSHCSRVMENGKIGWGPTFKVAKWVLPGCKRDGTLRSLKWTLKFFSRLDLSPLINPQQSAKGLD